MNGDRVARQRELARTAGLIDDDLGTISLRGAFGLYCLHQQTWVHRPGNGPGTAPAGFGSQGYVAAMFRSWHLVGGDVPSSGPDWVAVLSFVQDCAMDELGHGWPELYEDGRFSALLQPGSTRGQLSWLRSGQPFVPVGALGSLPSGTVKAGP